MAFTVVMKHFKKKLEQQRQEKGEAVPHGAPLYVREEAWHLAREDKLLQLGLGEKPGRVIDYVLDFLFADATTLVQRLRAEQAREVEEHDAQALKEETPLMPLEVVSLFGEVLTECGLRENESKRVQADVATIVTRNLGMDIDPEQDCRNKIRKAWQAYWTLRSRLSGIGGIGNARRGELVQIMIRSILLYGLQTRFVSQAEIVLLQKEENKILGQILDVKWWVREMRGWTYADLRRRAKVPAFRIHLRFLQARHFAHVMRMPKDRITRKALVGKFIPPGVRSWDGAADWMRSDANVSELSPADRVMPDMLQDRIRFLTVDCGLPIEMLQLLFESLEEANARRPELPPGQLYSQNKRIFYAATRKWFVKEAAADWARGDPMAEQRAADGLIEKYFGNKEQPNETREQVRRRAVMLDAPFSPEEAVRRHYRPSATGLENAFYGGQCSWCGTRFSPRGEDEIWCEPTELATVPLQLRTHLSQCHAVFQPDEEEILARKAFVQEAKEKDAERSKQIRMEIIGRNPCLREVRETGPRRPGRNTHVPKIACRYCRVHFTSSAGAMEMHAKAHLRDDYTKISQICRRVKGEDGRWHKVPINEYRPEQHQLHPNGHTFAGSDTCLYDIRMPFKYEPRFVHRREGPSIRCRFCKKYSIEYDEDEHELTRLGKAVSKMRKHEAICSARPKKVVVPWTSCKKMPKALKKKKVIKSI